MPAEIIVYGIGEQKVRLGSSIVYRKWTHPKTRPINGELVQLVSRDGEYLACGLWEEGTPVSARVLYSGVCEEGKAEDAIARVLEESFEARRRIGLIYRFDSYRLVNSDGDRLSGLIADVYGDVVVLQSSSPAIDKHLLRIADQLASLTGATNVFEKSIQRSRLDIGLKPVSRWIKGSRKEVIIEEGPVKFYVDVEKGQKTGFFLDQRFNRLEFGSLAGNGDAVLDVFSYTGGFGLHALAQGARSVVFVEEDPTAVQVLKRNLRLNGFSDQSAIILNESVWSLIDSGKLKREFTLVAVDPPAFIQRGDRMNVSKGLRAYRRVFGWASSLVGIGVGYFSSCSYFLNRSRFLELITRVLSRTSHQYRLYGDLRGAGPDHTLRGEEYLSYLKGAFVFIGS
ncbi:MAG: class I SAM-dependent rRNA methyltransferase [Aeropyrum sp.]|nr:class I SAM-dependent rRNA methyltransferase [Aeropyrum sp.]MCE4615972.1 class I SAM-dependent rRNA methyltransferase [Aeropyrum sp.]